MSLRAPTRALRRRRASAIGAAWLAAAGCAALAPPAEPPPGRPNETAFERARDGRIFAPVRLNGEGPFAFLVDTGAGASIIDDDIALALGLEPHGPPVTIVGLSSTTELAAHAPARLGIGADEIVLERILVHDLDRRGAEGVLGLDVLSRFAVEIDGPNEVIRLWDAGLPAPPRRAVKAALIMPANGHDLPYAAYRLNGRPGVAFIDTGYRGVIVDPDFAARAEIRAEPFNAVLTDLAYADIRFTELGAGRIAIGDAVWEDARMALVRPAVFDLLAEDDVTAMLGARLFADLALVLDFPARRVWLLEPARPVRRGVGP